MEQDDDLELGRGYIREGRPETALKSLHRSLLKHVGGENVLRSVDPKGLQNVPPELISYYGLCVALVENQTKSGILLCKMALEKDMFRPEFYLNLGKVYLKANQKSKALEIFRKGLQITDKNSELLLELNRYGTRRKPIVSFLSRTHFVNRYIGLFLRRKAGQPVGKKTRKGRAGKS